jgi:hypothetical protein
MALADALELDRLVTARAAFLDGVGGELGISPGKVLFFGCSGSSRCASSARSTSPAMPDSEIRIASARSSAAGAFCFAITTIVPGLHGTTWSMMTPETVGDRSASLKERGRVKAMVGWMCRLWVFGACARARVVGVAGVKVGRRPPRRGLALTPASDDADSSSGPDGQRGARVWCWGLGCAPWSSRSEDWQRPGCRGIPSPIGLRAWCVPATTRRAQAVRRPRRGRRGSCRSRARVWSCPSLMPPGPGRGSGSRRRAGRNRRA